MNHFENPCQEGPPFDTFDRFSSGKWMTFQGDIFFFLNKENSLGTEKKMERGNTIGIQSAKLYTFFSQLYENPRSIHYLLHFQNILQVRGICCLVRLTLTVDLRYRFFDQSSCTLAFLWLSVGFRKYMLAALMCTTYTIHHWYSEARLT